MPFLFADSLKLGQQHKPGRREKPVWMKQMAMRRRKTLVVCRTCHKAIHEGSSTTPFRKTGLEIRMRGNLARPVREEDNGKGP